jgi:hypothetical protein
MLNLLNAMICGLLQCGQIVLLHDESPIIISEPRSVDIEHCQRRTPDCMKYKVSNGNLIEIK